MPSKWRGMEHSMERWESTEQTNQWRGGSCKTEQKQNRTKPHHTQNLSVGLMVSTFSSAALRHFRFWSISLICSSISRQRLLVIVTGIAQARWWGGRKVKKEHSKETSSKMGKKINLKKNGKKNITMVMYVMSRRGKCKGSTNKSVSAWTLLNKAQKVPSGEQVLSAFARKFPSSLEKS